MERSADVRRVAVDCVPPLVLAAVGCHQLLYNRAPLWQWMTALGIVLLLGLRRRAPVPVLVLVVALAGVAWAHHVLLTVHLAVLVALHAVAWQRRRYQAWAAALGVEVVGIFVAFRFAPVGSIDDGIVLVTGLVFTAALLGSMQRTQREYATGLEDRAEQLRRDRNQRAAIAAGEERNRIAREIHDIVAHSVSVMVALSEGAARTASEDDARATMRQVASTGRDALFELRRVLDVLHSPHEDPSRSPLPSLEGLTSLVRDVRMAGLPVRLQVEGDGLALSDGLQATVFRVIQESLTNALKHARRADHADVGVLIESSRVVVTVADNGTSDLARMSEPESRGNGLRGMRDRARSHRGTVDAGPGPGGQGWAVRCVLPLEGRKSDDPSPARR